MNERTENIGARRLHTVMERLLDEASYGATDSSLSEDSLQVDETYVDQQLGDLCKDDDLTRFIL